MADRAELDQSFVSVVPFGPRLQKLIPPDQIDSHLAVCVYRINGPR